MVIQIKRHLRLLIIGIALVILFLASLTDRNGAGLAKLRLGTGDIMLLSNSSDSPLARSTLWGLHKLGHVLSDSVWAFSEWHSGYIITRLTN